MSEKVIEEIKVTNKIPVPNGRSRKEKITSVLRKMNVGDSFSTSIENEASYKQLVAQFKHRTTDGKNKNFTSRKLIENDAKVIRIWRTK